MVKRCWSRTQRYNRQQVRWVWPWPWPTAQSSVGQRGGSDRQCALHSNTHAGGPHLPGHELSEAQPECSRAQKPAVAVCMQYVSHLIWWDIYWRRLWLCENNQSTAGSNKSRCNAIFMKLYSRAGNGQLAGMNTVETTMTNSLRQRQLFSQSTVQNRMFFLYFFFFLSFNHAQVSRFLQRRLLPIFCLKCSDTVR